MRSWGLLRPAAQLRQPLRHLCDHIYPPLQLVLQFGDVHLVRDAIGVADALHIAVLDQFFQTPHDGYARQLQRVGDLNCANGWEVFNWWLCDKRGIARLSCDERTAPPVEPVV